MLQYTAMLALTAVCSAVWNKCCDFGIKLYSFTFQGQPPVEEINSFVWLLSLLFCKPRGKDGNKLPPWHHSLIQSYYCSVKVALLFAGCRYSLLHCESSDEWSSQHDWQVVNANGGYVALANLTSICCKTKCQRESLHPWVHAVGLLFTFRRFKVNLSGQFDRKWKPYSTRKSKKNNIIFCWPLSFKSAFYPSSIWGTFPQCLSLLQSAAHTLDPASSPNFIIVMLFSLYPLSC